MWLALCVLLLVIQFLSSPLYNEDVGGDQQEGDNNSEIFCADRVEADQRPLTKSAPSSSFPRPNTDKNKCAGVRGRRRRAKLRDLFRSSEVKLKRISIFLSALHHTTQPRKKNTNISKTLLACNPKNVETLCVLNSQSLIFRIGDTVMCKYSFKQSAHIYF